MHGSGACSPFIMGCGVCLARVFERVLQPFAMLLTLSENQCLLKVS